MKKYILAIDQGTTSSRAIIFDETALAISQYQIEHQNYFPKAAYVEHDPKEIWQNVQLCCLRALEKINLSARQIAAIGITNQRETTIIWDRKSGEAIYPAIVWQDRRTSGYCSQLKQKGVAAEITNRTGLLIDPYFSASKIAWILDHVPNARKRAIQGELAFGTIDSFLLWNLTAGKVHATDITNASRTSLFNIHSLKWDEDLLRIFDIPQQLLPEVNPNCFLFGETKTLFDNSIPIFAMIGDQQAAAVGQACFEPGLLKSTYGTGCFVLMNTGDIAVISKNNLITTILYQVQDKLHYALEGSIFIAGAGVKWLRDKLQIIKNSAETENIAASLPDNGGVYFVPAFTGLGAPYWRSEAHGLITGLTQETGKEYIVRALLEAVCYQTKDLLVTLVEDAQIKPKILRVDGGMVSNNWLMGFLANILQLTIERTKNTEVTALGVAYLAGLQAGIFNSLEEIANLRQSERLFQPQISEMDCNNLYAGWKQAVQKAL